MEKLKYSNIFDAITDDSSEAADLEFRADLMLLLREYFRAASANHADIGRRLGIPQPRVSELMTGKIDKFSADKLIGFLATIGIRFKPAYVASTRGKRATVKCDVSVARAD